MNSKSLPVLITIFSFVCFSAQSNIFMPSLQQTFGPLYNGVQLLIADQYLNAEAIWNETANQLEQTSDFLEQALEQLSHYNPSEHLTSFNQIVENPNFYNCYKTYEREFAHFNREFITKYEVCKATLNVAATHLEHETLEEINFVRNASREIKRVPNICNISKLKQSKEHHESVVVCVFARIGEINQRLIESAQLVLDIISEIVNASDMEAESCHAYNELKQQFDEINLSVNECINEKV